MLVLNIRKIGVILEQIANNKFIIFVQLVVEIISKKEILLRIKSDETNHFETGF